MTGKVRLYAKQVCSNVEVLLAAFTAVAQLESALKVIKFLIVDAFKTLSFEYFVEESGNVLPLRQPRLETYALPLFNQMFLML